MPSVSGLVRNVLLGLFAVVVLIVVALSLRTPEPPGLGATDSFDLPQVLVITGGAYDASDVAAAAMSIEWRGRTIVHEGAGIGRAPAGQSPLAVAVRSDTPVVGLRMLVVQGGDQDPEATGADFEVANYHLVDYVVASLPRGAIFVLAGPVPPPSGVTPALVARNKAMRFVARQRGVRYLDAIELGWTTGQNLTSRLAEQIRSASKPRTFAPPLPGPSAAPSGSASASASPSASPTGSPAGVSSRSGTPAPSRTTTASPSPRG